MSENNNTIKKPFEPSGIDAQPNILAEESLSKQNRPEPKAKPNSEPRTGEDNRKEAHRRIAALRETLETTRYVGGIEDLVPFAWNKPLLLSDNKKQSRVLKTMAFQEAERIRTAQIEQSEE